MTPAAPKLRFPQFKDAWKPGYAGDAFQNSRAKGASGLPIYSVTMDRGLVRRDSLERQMAADAPDDQNLRARRGDVVYNMMRMWQGAVGLASEECMVSPAYVVLSPKKHTSSEFFDQWFKSKRVLHLLKAYSHGITSDRLRLYADDFARIPMHLPTLPEQQKIAEFLGVVDAKIGALAAKKAALGRFKSGLIQKFFSQKLRFTDANGKNFPNWKHTQLSEILHEHKIKSTGNEQVFSVSVHKGLVNQIEHLGRSYSASDTNHYNLVKPGDVVYTKSPTGNFPLGIIKQSRTEFDVIVSPLYGVFTPITYDIGFLLDCYFQSSVNTINFLTPVVQKGAKNTISVTNKGFLSQTLLLPVSHNEQLKMADALRAVDGKIHATGEQVGRLQVFKNGLLQQMFVSHG